MYQSRFSPLGEQQDEALFLALATDWLGEGIAAAPAALAAAAELDFDDGGALLAQLHDQVIAALIAAFSEDAFSPAAYAALAAMPADHAAAMYDRMLHALFAGGKPDTMLLTPRSILCLVGMLSAAGAHEQAAVLLAEVMRDLSQPPAVHHAAWIARCRWAGCPSDLAPFWGSAVPHAATLAAADAAIARAELDVEAHRARVRLLAGAGKGVQALDALCVALTLPIGERDKLDLAEELALLAAVLKIRGEFKLFERPRTRWALAMVPKIVDAAIARMTAALADGTFAFLDEAEAAEIAQQLRAANPAQRPYPMRGGKPYLEIVWLEITNHCNQKCTFCPDMFREDARTWLPLEQIKAIIDDLAENCVVGSMQLNAYGEPLLHPNIAEILAYLREREVPFPVFFTTHGMTLVEKKLKQLSNNYPTGFAVSLHNDSQESYELTRSGKIGDYDTLVARVTGLLRQMVAERAPSDVRMYQMVSNKLSDRNVDPQTHSAFPDSPERMLAHVRKWEAIAAELAANAPVEARAQAHVNSAERIASGYADANHEDSVRLPLLSWIDVKGATQTAFMSGRPLGSYANLLLEYDPRWQVERRVVNDTEKCGFTTMNSLAIFATGKLGICCMDLNSTATFGALSDYASVSDAVKSPEALRLFAQLSNGVAASRGCQICLAGPERLCRSTDESVPRPTRPAGHFRDGI
ncbi:radical SAM protein [Sphingomonas sp. KR3-1]|uniref:radical SAM protein n=1 Tax=Sphingomonas sp. KR3-1 TaxID=3156611 RepID=UPI0032B3B6EB